MPAFASRRAAIGKTGPFLAVDCGTALLTTSTISDHIRENFGISSFSDASIRKIRENNTTDIRFNAVVKTEVPGFTPHYS